MLPVFTLSPSCMCPSVCFLLGEGQWLWEKDGAATGHLTFSHQQRCWPKPLSLRLRCCGLTVGAHTRRGVELHPDTGVGVL